MRRHRFLIVALFAGLPAFGFARSGEPLAARPVVGHVAAGFASPLSDAADFFDAGWQASAGATFHVSADVPVGLRLDLGYTHMPAVEQSLTRVAFPNQVHVDDGHVAVTHLMVDGLYEFGGRGRVGGWIGAGVGALHRRIEVTYTVPVIILTPMIPFELGLPIEGAGEGHLEGDDQLTQLGFEVTAAIRFPLPSGSEISLEARYERMESDPAIEFVPVTAGFRW